MNQKLVRKKDLQPATGTSDVVYPSDSDVYVDTAGGRCDRYLVVIYGNVREGVWCGNG